MRAALLGAVIAASLAAAFPAPGSAQSSFNIGPTPPPPPPGGGGGGGCISTVLAGNTSVHICPTYYTAQLGYVSCQGAANYAGGGYNLHQGPCNSPGQSFLGGRLVCGSGIQIGPFNIGGGGGSGGSCQWMPSPAGLAQGYHPETVFVR